MRGAASMRAFDGLKPSVRAALRDTVFEMDPYDFSEMTEQRALSWIRDIDSAVRAADRREKCASQRTGVKAAADRAEGRA